MNRSVAITVIKFIFSHIMIPVGGQQFSNARPSRFHVVVFHINQPKRVFLKINRFQYFQFASKSFNVIVFTVICVLF